MNQTKETLLNSFMELKNMETRAAKLYESILPDVTDPKDQEILKGIIKDEYRHEQIAQEIIDLLKDAFKKMI